MDRQVFRQIVFLILQCCIDRAAGDKLLRSVLCGVILAGLRRISNLAGADSYAPLIFIRRYISQLSSRYAVCLFQIGTDIRRVNISFIIDACISNGFLQLADCSDICSIGTVSDVGDTALQLFFLIAYGNVRSGCLFIRICSLVLGSSFFGI